MSSAEHPIAVVERARADSIEQARLAAETAARQAAEQNATLRADGIEALDRKLAILAANPDVRLKITGACDERGSDRYNQVLGERRAEAVKKYLVGKGVDVARLEVVSSGEKSPVDAGTGEAAWALNRRAEFAILSGDTPLAMN